MAEKKAKMEAVQNPVTLHEPKKQTLFDMAQDALALEQLIYEESGELSPTLEAFLSEVNTNLARKADSYQFICERFEASSEMLKKKAQKFLNAAKAMENARERLRTRIRETMMATNQLEISGSDVTFKLTKGAPRVVIDEKAVDKKYLEEVTVVTTVLLKDKLVADAKDTKDGEVMPAGIRFEPVYQLRTSVSKK